MLIVVAEEDIVEVQFGKGVLDAPVEDKCGGGFFLSEGTFGCRLRGEEFAVSKEGVHIADDGIEGDDFLLDTECGSGFIGDYNFRYGGIEVELYPEALGEFPDGLCDAVHTAGGVEGADMVFEMRYDGEESGCFVGIGTVVGGVSVEELDEFGVFDESLVNIIHGGEEIVLRDFEECGEDIGLEPGAGFVE